MRQGSGFGLLSRIDKLDLMLGVELRLRYICFCLAVLEPHIAHQSLSVLLLVYPCGVLACWLGALEQYVLGAYKLTVLILGNQTR